MISNSQDDGIRYPSIIFRAGGGLYCADSRYVSTILEQPKFQILPDTPPYITGIFPYRDKSITMFDLRTALRQPSMEEEYAAFSKMLDDRRQDHINWVNALEHSIETGERFTLATDPHQCALGQWFDHFHSDSQEITLRLSKLDAPHKKLHESALLVEQCRQQGDEEEQEKCIQQVLHDIHEEYVPQVLAALDDVKEIFRTRVYHAMVLVLSGDTSLGVVVDEVLAVEELSEEPTGTAQAIWSNSPYIGNVVRSENFPELILEVNLPAIMETASEEQQRAWGIHA